MSETTTQAPAAEAPETGAVGEPKGTDTFLNEESKRAVLDELYASRESVKQLKQQLSDYEAEKLSDLEKAQKAAADAQAAAAEAQREAMRYRLAAQHGISQEDAEIFLTGGTEEAMAAQAARLAARVQEPKSPKPDLTQGGGQGTPPALNSDALTESLKAAVGLYPTRPPSVGGYLTTRPRRTSHGDYRRNQPLRFLGVPYPRDVGAHLQ